MVYKKKTKGWFARTQFNRKLGEWTGQLWRDNSRRVRTHEKNSREAVRRLGTIIQSIFCAQSGTSILLTVWKWSGESRYWGSNNDSKWSSEIHVDVRYKFPWNPFNLASRRRLLWAWASWSIGESLDFISILKQQFKASLEQYFNFLSLSILRNAECCED